MRTWILWFVKGMAALAVIFSVTSCFKEDNPVQLPPPGDAKQFQVGLGKNYHRQVYFDLASTDTMGSEHSIWDLCFESTEAGWHVWINGGNVALIANTDTQDFEAITSTVGAQWMYDNPNWNIDSTAVGDWRIDRMVYILDRGPAKLSGDRYKKIIFQSVNDSEYEVQFSNMDGSGYTIFHLLKKPGNAYVYFSFDNGGYQPEIEPDALRWDVLFTRYRYVFFTEDPPLPYVVTGVLINPGIQVAVDSVLGFSSIDYEKAITLTYSSKRDIIGWDWKSYAYPAGPYIVRPEINYVLRDMEGVYWKLHFIDFYSSTGDPGYPQFEFQRL